MACMVLGIEPAAHLAARNAAVARHCLDDIQLLRVLNCPLLHLRTSAIFLYPDL
jgi:hypothetical protein